MRRLFKLALITAAASAACLGAVPGANVCPQAIADPGGAISGFSNTAYETKVAALGTCNLAIVVTNGSTTITVANSSPYDGDEDQVIGVTNNSTGTITSIVVSNPGASPAIFALEGPSPPGDGICAYQPFASNSQPCNGAAPGASNYAGSASSYTGINPAKDTGTINFSLGIPPGGTAYFSLEGPASASVTILFPLNLSKAFSPNPIFAPGNSTLTFTVSNPNSAAATNVSFSDTFPAGLAVAAAPGLTTNCPAGTTIVGASAGSTAVGIVIPSLAAGASCTLSLNVHTDIAGSFVNATSTITATGLPTGAAATTTLVAAVPAPSFSKSFTPNKIVPGGISTLTFSITNNDGVAVTGLAFTDTLPAGVVVATPNGLTDTCGGAVTATAGSGTISLVGGVVNPPIGTTCTISVNVVGTTEGVKVNTTSALTSTNAPPASPATATLIVARPPVLTKAFGEVSILPGGTTSLTFNLSNPNTALTLTGLAFTDTLPTGLVVATPNGLVGSCGGGTITAVAGSNTISLSSATLTAGASCTFSVNVTSNRAALGYVINTTSTVTSNEAVPGAPATATLFIGDPFQISYSSNLSFADSAVNISNSGANASSVNPVTQALNGNLCVNVYTFSPDEQMVACCSCHVTPNALWSLSARSDLVSNTLTPGVPTSVVVKLVATLAGPGGASGPGTAAAPTCNAATIAPFGPAGTANSLALGLTAWSTTIHGLGPSAVLPAGGTTPPPGTALALTEREFTKGTLSAAELTRLSTLCGFIQGNGSGFGICKSCRLGGLTGVSQ